MRYTLDQDSYEGYNSGYRVMLCTCCTRQGVSVVKIEIRAASISSTGFSFALNSNWLPVQKVKI